MKRIIFLLLPLALFPFRYSAADFSKKDRGTSSLSFLQLTPGAKEAGMGKIGTTEESGAESMYWNPANVGSAKQKQLFVSHSLLLEETAHSYFAFTAPLKQGRGFGLSVNYFSAGDINQTDAIGQSVGSFAPKDTAFSIGYSVPWQKFRFGITGKYIQSKIIHSANVVTADAGMIWALPRNIKIGLAGQNLTGKISYGNEEEPLPRLIRLGFSKELKKRWVFKEEETFSSTDDPSFALGTQYKMSEGTNFASFFRFGFNQAASRGKEDLAGLTLGAGLIYKSMDLDYAWVPLGDLGQTHSFSLNFRFR